MGTTTGRILDILAGAAQMTQACGLAGARGVWASMTPQEQLAFDLFLVRTRDTLAHWAGPAEARFVARAFAMATATFVDRGIFDQAVALIEAGDDVPLVSRVP